MDRFDRIYDLHKILSAARYPVSRQKLEQELECSRATVKRIIESMRLYLNAPIKYDRKLNGYIYDHGSDEPMYELPGIWFNASELHALLSVHQLLADVQPGLLEKQLAPLQERIEQLLNLQHQEGESLVQRIRILQMAARPAGEWFQPVAGATANRKQIKIRYYNRSRDDSSERTLSPQRLVHYRDNWYLDAWCHLREGLRTFALDSIESVHTLQEPAKSLTQEQLDEHYSSAYGIFSGKAENEAVLRFDAERARWVSKEQWHPQQQGEWLDEGSYRLTVPYGNPTELVMDILRHGHYVEVLEPEGLRQQVAEEIARMRALYSLD